MITRLSIKNFRSVIDAHLDLAPVTVLIGPNNCGKSNLLRALRTLSDVAHRGQHANLVSIDDFHRDNDGPIQLEAVTPDGVMTATVTRPSRPSEGAPNVDVRFQAGGQDRGSVGGPKRAKEADPTATIRMHALSSEVFSLELSDLRRSSHFQSQGADRKLKATGEGLPDFLFELQSERPDRFQAFLEDVRACAPEIKGITPGRTKNGQLTVKYWEEGASVATSIDAVSDGIVLLTTLIALRYSYEDHPGILLIEDPERGVHPRRLEQVVDVLFELSQTSPPTQIVMTSHSPYFLDRFRDAPESVVIVEFSLENGTTCRSLTSVLEADPQHGEMSLGELWYAGVLGGVPQGLGG